MTKPDLDSTQRIKEFVDAFYAKVLNDKQLAPIFIDVADIDLDVHLPLIRSYWEKLLLGDKTYSRHTMNIHRAVHAQRVLTAADFERWRTLFVATVDANFAGDKAERAKKLARQIAANMHHALADHS